MEGAPMPTATKTKMKIIPLQDRVVIRPLEETETMRGGLYIPDTAKEKPQAGEIIAVGPGRLEKGERVPMDLKVGQKVIYSKYAGTEYRIEDEEVVIMKESDVHAVIG
jgi:chaperonin GroES